MRLPLHQILDVVMLIYPVGITPSVGADGLGCDLL